MKKSIHVFATAAFAAVTLFGAGCAVVRQQETVGAYVDDTTITTQIKSRMAADPTVAALSISVETLKGEVQLSGFAKSAAERSKAEVIARDINGVKRVRNDIVVRN
jgi:hyperosmotically inducible protein